MISTPRNNEGATTEGAADPSTQSGTTLRQQARKVVRDVGELGAIAFDEVAGKVGRAKDRGRETVRQGRARAMRAENEFERLIGTHPFKSLFVALGVGALLGLTLRRNRRAEAGDAQR